LYNRKSKGTGSLEYRKIILADKQLHRNPKTSSIKEEYLRPSQQTIIGRTSNMIQPEMATTQCSSGDKLKQQVGHPMKQTHCSVQQHARGPYLWGGNLTLMDSYQAGKRQSTKPAERNRHQLPPVGRPPTKTISARGAAGIGHQSRDPTRGPGATHQQATPSAAQTKRGESLTQAVGIHSKDRGRLAETELCSKPEESSSES
jgi:hypothetical protein